MRFTVNTKINQDSNFLFTSTFELKFDTQSRVALEPVKSIKFCLKLQVLSKWLFD